MIDGAPEVVTLAVDPDENLVEMPAPVSEGSHRLDALATDLAGKHGAEPVPPEPHSFMADVDAALGQKVLDLSE